ncbi:MAG: RnfABCDGE type electron transport complex subunit G [Candidatus Delongbacteria bacterium]
MGNTLKLSGILFLVAGIAAGTLAFYNSFTRPEIEKLNRKLEKEARQYVLKGLFDESVMDDLIYEEVEYNVGGGKKEKFWKVKEHPSDKDYKAYVFLSKKQGFSGVIETMVGTDEEFGINRIKVVKHTETPGLGAEVQTKKYGEKEPYFEKWFRGKNSLKVVVEKDNPSSKDRVQSLTGATITTRAVCESIQEYAEYIQKAVGPARKKIMIRKETVVPDPKHVIEVDIKKLQEEQTAEDNSESNTGKEE